MGLFLLKRLAGLAVTLLVASMVVFAALEILPGNAAQVMLGPDAAPAAVQALERQLGLDQPAIVRYEQWIGGLLYGNMGTSYAYGSQASHMIAGSLALTIPLALLALFLACIMALAGGMYAAARHRRAGDAWMMALSQLGMAIPGFWLAMLLILVFSVRLRWFAAGGFDGWGSHPVQWLRSLKSLVLPALALSLVQAAVLMRITRAAMLEVLQEDFVRTARARGLSPRAVLFRHVLRNALIPVLTLSGLQFANLLAGAIVVENVFFLPGLGRLLFQSIANRDLVVVRNGVLVLATLVILVNAGVDLLQALVDPRLRQPQRAEEGSGA
ncbi:MAG: ABC transporter permease [Brachymonas sp.]